MDRDSLQLKECLECPLSRMLAEITEGYDLNAVVHGMALAITIFYGDSDHYTEQWGYLYHCLVHLEAIRQSRILESEVIDG